MSLTIPVYVARLCRERTVAFAHTRAPEWRHTLPQHIAAVTVRVQRNLSNGRAQRVLGLPCACVPPAHILSAYIDRVVQAHHAGAERFARLQAHEAHSWRALREEWRRAAHSFLARLGVSNADAAGQAEDFAQQLAETFRLENYPCDVAFEFWWKRVLYNQILQVLRKRSARETSLDALLSEGMDDSPQAQPTRAARFWMDRDAATAFERMEDMDLLLRAMAQLPPNYREVLSAAYFEELDNARIAQQLGKSKAQVELLKHRARRALKKILETLQE